MPFRPPWPPGTHVIHKHRCRQKTIHIKKKCKNNTNFKYEGFDNSRCRGLFELESHTCTNCVETIPCREDGEPPVPVSPWLTKQKQITHKHQTEIKRLRLLSSAPWPHPGPVSDVCESALGGAHRSPLLAHSTALNGCLQIGSQCGHDAKGTGPRHALPNKTRISLRERQFWLSFEQLNLSTEQGTNEFASCVRNSVELSRTDHKGGHSNTHL